MDDRNNNGNGQTITDTDKNTTYQGSDAISKLVADLEGFEGTNKSLTKLDKSMKIEWKWAFGTQNDDADTILGNLMAQGGNTNTIPVKTTSVPTILKALEVNTDYCLDIGFSGGITVTQVD